MVAHQMDYDDFLKIDIRVGQIIEVKEFLKAKKPAYQLFIDFGDLGIKKSSAQITDHYSKTDLLRKQVVTIINFRPRQIANFMSECLVLGIYDSNNKVVILQPSDPTKNGYLVL